MNPNEDMAESIAYYVENPALLQSCCPDKFAFIRDRIMHGYRYVTQVREDLTFQVLNLSPDFVYPGKIIAVDIAVIGAPTEDKTVVVTITVNTAGGAFEEATRAYFRLFSEIGTYVDHYLHPVDCTTHYPVPVGGTCNGLEDTASFACASIAPAVFLRNLGSYPMCRLHCCELALEFGITAPASCGRSDIQTLSGTLQISKYAKAGLWHTDRIELTDLHDNKRFAGTKDFGWRLHIDNPLEDFRPPVYVNGSVTITATAGVDQGNPVHNLVVSWLLTEETALLQNGGVYVRLVSDGPGNTYELQEYGYPGNSGF